MTSSLIPNQKLNFPDQQQRDNRSHQCKLQWRQGQLLVSLDQDPKQPYLPSLESEKWLVRCLKHSPVQLVYIDPNLGEAVLKRWVNACEQAKKPVFLRGYITRKLPWKQSHLSWFTKRLIDLIATFLLLLILSPVMLLIAVLIYLYSPGGIFSHTWNVGTRGKVFRVFSFRTTQINDESCPTRVGRWMCKYRLHKLPQLFNVLRGEMSVVGAQPWSLSDAVRLISEGQRQLNVLPGIIQLQGRKSMLTQIEAQGLLIQEANLR